MGAHSFYVTTAIDYVNGRPHLGHAYEKVLADVIARYQRLKGSNVHFLTGLDEHGQKVQQKAQAEGLAPIEYCNQTADAFHDLLQLLNISNNDFIRTTESRHRNFVQKCLQQLYDAGLIYKAEYTGFYSVKEERFLQEKDKVNGEWPALYGEVKFLTEYNYFFKLSQYQNWLVEFITKNPGFILPSFRQKQVLEFLKEPLNDLCISRPVERLSWGIPLPFDQNFVTYVWFDALLNYVSAVEEKNLWPADLHVIGKDILVPAHAVYWPIILKALNLPLPKQILAHGWWLSQGNKLSKSLGNAFEPLTWIKESGVDACRYFLMREMTTGQDSEFSNEIFENRYNCELANEWGNLVGRTLNMISRYRQSILPKLEDCAVEAIEENLRTCWDAVLPKILEAFDQFQFSNGLESLFSFIKELNRYADQRAPWKLAKNQEDSAQRQLNATLLFLMEGIRLSAFALLPVMPEKSSKVVEILSMDLNQPWVKSLTWQPENLGLKSVGAALILFPKKQLPQQ